jgi:PKD repeat protein
MFVSSNSRRYAVTMVAASVSLLVHLCMMPGRQNGAVPVARAADVASDVAAAEGLAGPLMYQSPSLHVPLNAQGAPNPTTAYTWKLGDGITTTGQTISHQYPATGTYTAIVTADNPLNSPLSGSVVVTITDVPLQGLTVTNSSPVRPGQPVTLSAGVLTGTPASYAWAFGDGGSGVGNMVTHTYGIPGLYTATVTATNASNSLTARTTVTVMKQFFLPGVLNHWPYMPGTPVLSAIDNAIGAMQYAVTWTSVSDASSYLLQESTSAAFTNPSTAYAGSQTSASISGKTAGMTYYYRVASITGTYQSNWSNVVSTQVTLVANTLVNGGFESGIPPRGWVERSTVGELISTYDVHSGYYAAYLGGVIDAEDSLYQAVALSSDVVTATLTYWHNIRTTDTIYYPYDTLSCVIWDAHGNVLGSCGEFSNMNRSDGWVQSSANLVAYKGQVVRIGFKSYNNSLYATQFFIDDVSLQITR